MPTDDYTAIAAAVTERYTTRKQEHGATPATLGWDTQAHMGIRFDAVLRALDLDGRVIVDHGCGFGDLVGHLETSGITPRRYIGLDLTPPFIDEAMRRYGDRPNVEFETLREDQVLPKPRGADVTVMLGLLNFRYGPQDDEYATDMLAAAFHTSHEAVAVDFISNAGPEVAPPWIRPRAPSDVLEWGLALTSEVTLFHDYRPIPLREMLLVLKHET